MSLFEFFGIEIELMIVDKASLKIKPISDLILCELNEGVLTGDVELGPVSVSNELVTHVIEFKSTQPTFDLAKQARDFNDAILRVNAVLAKHDATLLGSGMHPFMNPEVDRHLWPHDNSEIYGAYDRIFDCRGHGWSNLQSMHVNLPFSNDKEFRSLHSCIRILLPFIPALAASSPLVEGHVTGQLDSRLFYYFENQKKIPEIAGSIIPDVFRNQSEYQAMLETIYKAVSPFDPQKILQEEWLNSRGAIARYDRGAIEIRLTDVQENPFMDLALAAYFHSVLEALVSERWASIDQIELLPSNRLFDLLQKTATQGSEVKIQWPELESAFGLSKNSSVRDWIDSMGLVAESSPFADFFKPWWKHLVQKGNLASRILSSLPKNAPSREEIKSIYSELALCLSEKRPFL